jgi:hypothetical protein
MPRFQREEGRTEGKDEIFWTGIASSLSAMDSALQTPQRRTHVEITTAHAQCISPPTPDFILLIRIVLFVVSASIISFNDGRSIVDRGGVSWAGAATMEDLAHSLAFVHVITGDAMYIVFCYYFDARGGGTHWNISFICTEYSLLVELIEYASCLLHLS